MEKWKQMTGRGATYNNLISVFEKAGYSLYADTVREIVKQIPNNLGDSSSDDVTPPISATLTVQTVEHSPSPVPSPVSITVTTASVIQEGDTCNAVQYIHNNVYTALHCICELGLLILYLTIS